MFSANQPCCSDRKFGSHDLSHMCGRLVYNVFNEGWLTLIPVWYTMPSTRTRYRGISSSTGTVSVVHISAWSARWISSTSSFPPKARNMFLWMLVPKMEMYFDVVHSTLVTRGNGVKGANARSGFRRAILKVAETTLHIRDTQVFCSYRWERDTKHPADPSF